jgi:uncharacterized protein
MSIPETYPFHTFLIKVSSRCNINCSYCYVYHLEDQQWKSQPKTISPATFSKIVERIFEHCRDNGKKDVHIIFHGGEPLLIGLDRMRLFVEIILARFKGSGIKVYCGIQSNGLLFNREIGDFMLLNSISLGISLDGPPRINDLHRVDFRGMGTSKRLEKKLDLIASPAYQKIFSGFLVVVNPDTNPEEILSYLLSYNPPSIDFLLPLDNYDRRPKYKTDFESTVYGKWLSDAFDVWAETPSTTSIRYFVSIIRRMMGQSSLVESIGSSLVDLIVIESDGSIEGVDSLKSSFDTATKLNYNVFGNSFDEVALDLAVRSRQTGADGLCQKCQSCPIVQICGGGYLPHRYSSSNQFDNPSIYCRDIAMLIRHINGKINSMVYSNTIKDATPPVTV